MELENFNSLQLLPAESTSKIIILNDTTGNVLAYVNGIISTRTSRRFNASNVDYLDNITTAVHALAEQGIESTVVLSGTTTRNLWDAGVVGFYKNSRPMKTFFVHSMDVPTHVSPAIRVNVDFIFIVLPLTPPQLKDAWYGFLMATGKSLEYFQELNKQNITLVVNNNITLPHVAMYKMN